MNKTIPPIKAEIDFLNNNEHEIYCVSNWVQTKIDGNLVPVRVKAIREDGIIVTNSRDERIPLLSAEKILMNLYTLLSSSKESYSTRPALCIQYAALLIEIDNAIVRLSIDKNLLRNAKIEGSWHINYGAWAEKLKTAGKNWDFKGYKGTDNVCYFYPGFDYEQFIGNHEVFWTELHEKLDGLVEILGILDELVSKGKGAILKEDKERMSVEARASQIYISYSWATQSEIDDICRALTDNGITFRRDVIDCGYKKSIQEFETEIGEGAKVLAFIGDDYLRSINCMYELALVFQKGLVTERLFPVVKLSGKRDASFFEELFNYWNEQYLAKRGILDKLPSGVSLQAINELGICDTIVRELPKIVQYLSDINSLSYEELSTNSFYRLIDAIKEQ